MIFGKTYKNIKEQEQINLFAKCKVKKVFALLPVDMYDGRVLWLQYYYYVEPIFSDESGKPFYSDLLAMYRQSHRFYNETEAKLSETYLSWVKAGWVN